MPYWAYVCKQACTIQYSYCITLQYEIQILETYRMRSRDSRSDMLFYRSILSRMRISRLLFICLTYVGTGRSFNHVLFKKRTLGPVIKLPQRKGQGSKNRYFKIIRFQTWNVSSVYSEGHLYSITRTIQYSTTLSNFFYRPTPTINYPCHLTICQLYPDRMNSKSY
jgi:hypothetical protein